MMDWLVKLGELGPIVLVALVGLVAVMILGLFLLRILPVAVGALNRVSESVTESTSEFRQLRGVLVSDQKVESSRSEQRHIEVMTAITGLRTDFLSDAGDAPLPKTTRHR